MFVCALQVPAANNSQIHADEKQNIAVFEKKTRAMQQEREGEENPRAARLLEDQERKALAAAFTRRKKRKVSFACLQYIVLGEENGGQREKISLRGVCFFLLLLFLLVILVNYADTQSEREREREGRKSFHARARALLERKANASR